MSVLFKGEIRLTINIYAVYLGSFMKVYVKRLADCGSCESRKGNPFGNFPEYFSEYILENILENFLGNFSEYNPCPMGCPMGMSHDLSHGVSLGVLIAYIITG